MRRKALDKIVLTDERKQHYKNLNDWLKQHPEIEYKKLSPIGFSVNISTIPEHLVDKWIGISTFKEN